ncbi:MAG TPA: hypothetical protein VHI52_21850, partial [Verrucomicrobiae bacterium]|nr:hypothetical protein [Verrucomicrobiae bacterium]
WEPIVRVTTVSFIQNQNEVPFNRGGWAVYVPTNRPESINNDLFTVRPNHSYLVNVSGSQVVQVSVSGQPSIRPTTFEPDAFTLRGFPVDPSNPPTFQDYFAPSPAHYNPASAALQRMYRLNNSTAQWVLVAPTDRLTRGEAYWVYTSGSSSYDGPLSVTPSVGDGLNFGATAGEKDLTLQNRTSNPLEITIADLGLSNLPLVYYGFPTNSTLRSWLPLPRSYTLNLPANSTQRFRIGVQRGQMTNDTFATVLSVGDGRGTQYHVVVAAQRSTPFTGKGGLYRGGTHQPLDGGVTSIPPALEAGLWVGDVTVNAVAETYNNQTNTTPTTGSFDLRLILHVTPTGVTRLLREVIEMYQNGTYTTNDAGQRVVSQPGQYVLLTDDSLLPQYTGVALRDGTPVGRRISTAGFDFEPPGGTNFLTMTGSFGVGNSVTTTIRLTPQTPTNPFLHRYHPDHDNLDSFFNPISGSNAVQEVYTISRQIELQFAATDPTGQTATDYGYNEIGGYYQETISGLHRNPLATSGVFHLRRLSTAPVLNQNQ